MFRKILITQNIDGLHYMAGSRNVVEYHGNTRELICIKCKKRHAFSPEIFEKLPPGCECGGVLKPAIVFFGEEIPMQALLNVQKASEKTDVLLVIGTTGEIFPAYANIPRFIPGFVYAGQEGSGYSVSWHGHRETEGAPGDGIPEVEDWHQQLPADPGSYPGHGPVSHSL